MERMKYRARQRRAFAKIPAQPKGAPSALLITHLPDLRYLSGFTGSNGALLLTSANDTNRVRATLFTDGRYTLQAKAEAIGTGIVISPKSAVLAAIAAAEAEGVTACFFDPAQTTVASLDAMRRGVSSKLRRSFFTPVEPVIASLREIKDADEIAVIRRAALLGCHLYDQLLGSITSGMSEAAVAASLEHAARIAGAERMSFETIVASGERSALPHGRASMAKLPRRGFVTLDFGVVLEGYSSDMTRTIHLGKPSPEQLGVYDAVLEAQEAAVARIAAGVMVGDVDEAARSVLRRAGLDKYFTHSTGHGVGLEIHEGPRLATQQTQKLAAGMVVTVEPGVYLPGRFGVRIEDMVLVTPKGGEILTPSVKAWTQLEA